jgi:hypothetical protein
LIRKTQHKVKDRLSNRVDGLKATAPFAKKNQIVLWAGLFVVFGLVVVIATRAASSAISLEPELSTVNSPAQVGGDASASGGSYVKFGLASSGNGNAVVSNACKYYSSPAPTQLAFCETFDTPYAGTRTQTGDLDPVLWGVSRMGDNDTGQGKLNAITMSHNMCARPERGPNTTGSQFQDDDAPGSTYRGPATPPPDDARICDNHYVESVNDGGSVVDIDSYPKQPFDFTGRTGRVVFDLGNDSTGGHGAWPEFVITDEPVPGIRTCVSVCDHSQPEASAGLNAPHAKNEVIFRLAEAPDGSPHTLTGVHDIQYTKNGSELITVPFTAPYGASVTKGSATSLNHYEIAISTTHITIYATNPGQTQLVTLADVNFPESLGFSKGLVWINDAHYNARKNGNPCDCAATYDHSFVWDNLGFDGPKTYRDLGYDVPLAAVQNGSCNQNGDCGQQVSVGYLVGNGPRSFNVTGVTWQQPPTFAKIVLNSSSNYQGQITAVLNDHNEHAQTYTSASQFWDSASFTFPASDAVQGTNKLTFSSGSSATTLTNISLIMVAGAPVP